MEDKLGNIEVDAATSRKQRRVDMRVNVDLAMLPGPPGFLNGPWVQVQGGCISVADIAAWPYSVRLLWSVITAASG